MQWDSRRFLLIALGITVSAALILWIMIRDIGAINEASYQFDRIQQLAAGGRPFLGFEHIYGPIILSLPVVFQRASHMPLLDAYFLSWTLQWTAGVYLTWLTAKWAGGTFRLRTPLLLQVPRYGSAWLPAPRTRQIADPGPGQGGRGWAASFLRPRRG